MKELNLKEIKSIELNILSAFHDYCEKHNLTYYLAYGTLLGAVRHKGFIPWDDDIDVYMPRKDYIILKNDFKNKIDNLYQIISEKNIKGYHLPFLKIIDSSTILYEAGFDTKLGVYIDVFPLDNYNTTKITPLRIIKGLVFTPAFKRRSFLKNFTLNIFKFTHPYLKNHGIYKRELKSHCNYLISTISVFKNYEIFNHADFDKRILLNFENKQFFAPIGYKNCLEILYGDYMQLPPLNQRNSQHSFVAYKIEQ